MPQFPLPITHLLLLCLLWSLGSLVENVDIQPGPHVAPKEAPKVEKEAVERPDQKKGDIPTLTLNTSHVRPEAPDGEQHRGDLIFPGNSETPPIASDGVIHETYQTPTIESGAVKRGILVFVVLGMLFIGYVGFKTYRNRGKTPNIVKYGVRARRTDMEMRPFSMEEDEEDETLFDLKHVNNTN